MTARHPPCRACQRRNKACVIPEDLRRWKRSTAAAEAPRKDMRNAVNEVDNATSSVDGSLWGQKCQTKGEMPKEAKAYYRQDFWDDSAKSDFNSPELSIRQQIEQLNPPQIASLLFSHFAMTPRERAMLGSLTTSDMEALGVQDEDQSKPPSSAESRLAFTENTDAALPPQSPLEMEDALFLYMYTPTRRDIVPPFSDNAYT